MENTPKTSDNQNQQKTAVGTMQELTNGVKGDSVKELQNLLTKKGFELKVDGAFGEKTEKAVRDFQTKNSLKVDGQVGNMTWESLRKVTA